jgi:RimJ/RimL family protein N-acetyltransferase
MTLVLREIGRPPSEDDLQLLFDLLLERPSWANISHKEMPSFEQHVEFVTSSPYQKWWIIEGRMNDQKHYGAERSYGDTPVKFEQLGSVYLTKNNELGIAILSSKQNKGYATWAILKVVEMCPGRDLLANVAPTNDRSQKLFEGLGFTELQKTYVLRGS